MVFYMVLALTAFAVAGWGFGLILDGRVTSSVARWRAAEEKLELATIVAKLKRGEERRAGVIALPPPPGGFRLTSSEVNRIFAPNGAEVGR